MVMIRIADILDEDGFRAIPPCADPGFDHRTCDHWEDAERGSKASRLAWLEAPVEAPQVARPISDNPFLAERPAAPANPFLVERTTAPVANPFRLGDDDGDVVANPFAPPPPKRPAVEAGGLRKLALLTRGLGVIGSYAKVLYRDEVAVAYCQFGPLTAYPRAQRTRDLYPRLPDAPLPAVITCISTTAVARGEGLALHLVRVVCEDLATRGFTAVETYPDATAGVRPDSTSAATPAFWESAGFARAIDDPRYPVMRRELG